VSKISHRSNNSDGKASRNTWRGLKQARDWDPLASEKWSKLLGSTPVMFTKRFRRVQYHLQDEINAMIKKIEEGIPKSLRIDGVKGVIVESRRGWSYPKVKEFSVPLAAYERGYDFFIYYTAHEMAHIYANTPAHNEEFYEWFRVLCPEEFQKYEFNYIKRSKKFLTKGE